jgi:transcriptional regulator with GAF, ATPase, and Fis domain
MITSDRNTWDAFVQLADTLLADFDIVDFLDMLARRSADLLGVTASGLLLADEYGTLSLVAASTEQAWRLELLQLQSAEGPCVDCFHSGQSVRCPVLAEADSRWPYFAPAARQAGFAAVYALPMRLRNDVIGAMSLFTTATGEPDSDTAELGQCLADIATIGILREREVRRHAVLAEQLQTALNSRVLIEQAKGVVAERVKITVEDAFTALRAYARSNNRKLLDVAKEVVQGGVTITAAASRTRDVRTQQR